MSFEMNAETDNGINEINMTPFVDVMLVLLVIFIVTIPVVRQAIELDLPAERGTHLQQNAEVIEISINAHGEIFYRGNIVSDEELSIKFKQLQDDMSHTIQGGHLIHIRGDQNARYARIATVMSLAQRHGLTKISFIMDGIAN